MKINVSYYYGVLDRIVGFRFLCKKSFDFVPPFYVKTGPNTHYSSVCILIYRTLLHLFGMPFGYEKEYTRGHEQKRIHGITFIF